jgi:hypothetical protein
MNALTVKHLRRVPLAVQLSLVTGAARYRLVLRDGALMLLTRMAHLKYLSITSFLVAITNLKNDGSTWGDVTADTVNLPNGEKMSLYLSIMALRKK